MIAGGAVATSPEDELRESLLSGYKKNVHPPNEFSLLYTVVYLACPIPDPDTGALVSRIHETQVGYG